MTSSLRHLKIHPRVANDLEEVVNYYESEQVGLGGDFLRAFRKALRRIEAGPEVYRKVYGENRRVMLPRFGNFAVIYTVNPDIIYIKAVADLRRRPLYWGSRA
ncbi:MAG: plasmid stabilization system [Puniceicoccaceae bacterium 5H]|nr:MAG: plasmid stabilization system [Puniceicoccaceae bacterium 5H]